MSALTRVHLDRSEKLIHVERLQDVEDILEDNKRLQGEQQRSDMMRHTGRVPAVVIEQWLNEEHKRGNTSLRFLGPGFDDWLIRKLKDPDNRAWRVDNPSNPFFMGWR